MARIFVTVPDEERDALQRLAAREALSLPDLVRRALKRALEENAKPSRRELMERASRLVGKFRSGVTDLGERHDEYIAEAIEDEHVPGHVGTARASR